MDKLIIEEQNQVENKIQNSLEEGDSFYPDYQLKVIFYDKEMDDQLIEDYHELEVALSALDLIREKGYHIPENEFGNINEATEIQKFTNNKDCKIVLDIEYLVNREHHSFGGTIGLPIEITKIPGTNLEDVNTVLLHYNHQVFEILKNKSTTLQDLINLDKSFKTQYPNSEEYLIKVVSVDNFDAVKSALNKIDIKTLNKLEIGSVYSIFNQEWKPNGFDFVQSENDFFLGGDFSDGSGGGYNLSTISSEMKKAGAVQEVSAYSTTLNLNTSQEKDLDTYLHAEDKNASIAQKI